VPAASPRSARAAGRATTWGELIAALVELCGDDEVAVQTAAALVQHGRIHAPDGTPWTLA
jgi:hypothetical protein